MNETNRNKSRSGEVLIQEVNNTEVPYGCLSVWFLGQESVIIKGGGVTVYVDPFVSEFEGRSYPAPIRPEHITGADLCLITHEHIDHMDPATLSVMVRNNPSMQMVAPAWCREQLLEEAGVKEDKLADAETAVWRSPREGIRIQAIPAAHEQLEQNSQGFHRYVGYLMELNGVILYHAGDTVIYKGLLEKVRQHNVDLAMLPINGRDYFRTSRDIIGNMDYREAAEFAYAAGFETVIPLHYDLFAGNAENPGYFADYLYRHFPEQKFHIMARAERFVYVSPRAFLG
ncbi:MBL fold metallo-hydrolase [Paenibacillus yonginensis]|uniref:MBL fold metallo-hydrolase n=1 Tax=Paenibacillus yonginensis TaxID=1462996 RepID=A0A1B1N0P5_9BACL|nr:MBL fold metallo-hydrolase [Paenibacillus yonginensis]ANS74978.1 MBL fold metallo-hydrolase [Paenibacillus yonginensis]